MALPKQLDELEDIRKLLLEHMDGDSVNSIANRIDRLDEETSVFPKPNRLCARNNDVSIGTDFDSDLVHSNFVRTWDFNG